MDAYDAPTIVLARVDIECWRDEQVIATLELGSSQGNFYRVIPDAASPTRVEQDSLLMAVDYADRYGESSFDQVVDMLSGVFHFLVVSRRRVVTKGVKQSDGTIYWPGVGPDC